MAFYLNMVYIYTSSVLLFLEISNPCNLIFKTVFGYYHGLMLGLGLSVGWGLLFIIGSVIQRAPSSIYYNSNEKKIKVKYLTYYKELLF